MTVTTLTHRSYSQVRTLRTCGEQYRLTRIEHLSERPSTAAVGGTVIHLATEVIDQQIHGGNTDRDDLTALALQAADVATAEQIDRNTEHYPVEEWKRYGRATIAKPHGEDMGWFTETAIPNAIQAYLDFRLVDHPELSLYDLAGFGPAIEVPFSLFLNSVQVNGYIDRIMQAEDGQLYLLDLKSGRKPDNDEQLGTYRMALVDAGIDATWGGYVYALKTGEAKLTPPIDLSHWTYEKLALVYGEADRQINAGIFIPHPGEACFHCPVSHHCQYAQSVI